MNHSPASGFDWLLRTALVFAVALTLSACEVNEEAVTGPTGSNPPPAGNPPGSPPPDPTPPPDQPPPDQPPDMPPPDMPPPPPPPPSTSDQMLFEATLHPLLTDPANFCAGCHGASQVPLFAVGDATTAYNAITSQQKVNLVNPELSRVYVRPRDERHNCGGDMSCDRIAADFLAAIQDWANQVSMNAPPPSNSGEPVVSAMTTFADAVEGGPARVEDAAIAVFEFSEGAGDITVDSSGVGTPITLNIEGMEWEDGLGLRNVSGKAQASEADSRKLFDRIAPENAYTVEAWVIPDNTAQDGPARIVSYSQDTATRNFTLGQNAIYYQLRNRSAGTGANGTPELEALEPQVDTLLTHVVATFDGASGRKVYINGQLSIEENVADTLDWQDNQLLVIGNEVTNDRLWQGVFGYVAIHNRALTDVEVRQNFDAGAGTLLTMRFDLAPVIGEPAVIEMQAAQLDSAGYLFARPVFISDATGIPVRNMRIGINGGIPVAEQSFRRIDTVVLQSGQELSPLGAVIPVQLGPDNDRFHLEFELLGSQVGMAGTVPPSSPPPPAADVPDPEYGVRTFSQVNDAMSSLTGVDANVNTVLATYSEVRDSLPSTPDPNAFAAAQQIAIQRLAIGYCGAIVEDAGRCDAFFGACEIDGAGKAAVATTLYDRFIGNGIGIQPDAADVSAEIVSMIDDLGCANGCNGAEGREVLQATCAAVLSSAAVTIN